MSRLTDLISAARELDAQLGADLNAEFKVLSERLSYGLNFERHRPETVELPQRPIRRGDKVRILPPRGSRSKGDSRLWVVKKVQRVKANRIAHVEPVSAAEPESKVVDCGDLLVVAEFRDPIYPGLTATGQIERGSDKPYHTVINGENFHVLKALSFTHRGRIDAIYIDPPYNTRDKQWKYNNDYVDSNDLYRHSKWLAFMERRLRLAGELLKPDNSALVVAIDEKEVHRLGLLLEQVFPEAAIEMVTVVYSAKGAVRRGHFSRVEEHLFYVLFGDARVRRWTNNMLPTYRTEDEVEVDDDLEESAEEVAVGPTPIEWLGLRRREPSSIRGSRPNQFYPIFVRVSDGSIHSIGDPIDDDVKRTSIRAPRGTVALWPLKPDDTEMIWGLTPSVLRVHLKNGYVRVKNWKKESRTGTVSYLPSGTIAKIADGSITVTGRGPDGAVEGYIEPGVDGVSGASGAANATPPKRVWNLRSHNAETGGTKVLSALIPRRHFDYPKSLYAVEDALRFLIGTNKQAIVLDFFAGSGTTTHAVMRLNRQDGGQRQCIAVTNNEVSDDEQGRLREQKRRPGDKEWEEQGICEFITKPRVTAAISGKTPGGRRINGDYKFVDPFPMSEGFEENAAFFTLTYETPISVSHHRAFAQIAPLLWLRAGAIGRCIDTLPETGWDVADSYGIVVDLDHAIDFCTAVQKTDGLRVAYVVTDDDRRFQSVARHLPDAVEVVQLYEDYLLNFRFVNGD